MIEVDFPTRGPGYLDISRADDALRHAVKLYLIDNITLYEDGAALPPPRIAYARVSLTSTARSHPTSRRADGEKPTDEKLEPYNRSCSTSSQFSNPVHCVKIAKDGLVYVCDRANNRIQVFRKDGSFVKEFAYEKNTRASGSVWDLDFWIDGRQTFLFNADGTNNEVRTLVRDTGDVVGYSGASRLRLFIHAARIPAICRRPSDDRAVRLQPRGRDRADRGPAGADPRARPAVQIRGRGATGRDHRLGADRPCRLALDDRARRPHAGEFHWVHNLAIDSKGNLYTTEVDTGKRAQKFRYIGPPVVK